MKFGIQKNIVVKNIDVRIKQKHVLYPIIKTLKKHFFKHSPSPLDIVKID